MLVVSDDQYREEVSWSLELPDGTIWATGGAASTHEMCAPSLAPTIDETPPPSSGPTPAPSALPTTTPEPTSAPTATPVPSATPTELERCYSLEMEDWYGDGWNGAAYTWTNKANGQQLLTGTLADGTNGTASLCVYSTSGCYTLEISSGDYDREISWALISPDGSPWANGSAPGTADLCAPSPVPTTPMPSVSSIPTPAPSKSFKPTPQPTTPKPTSTPTTPASACHALYMYDTYGDGWNGAVWTWINLDRGVALSTGTLDGGSSGINSEAICTYDSSDCYTLVVSR